MSRLFENQWYHGCACGRMLRMNIPESLFWNYRVTGSFIYMCNLQSIFWMNCCRHTNTLWCFFPVVLKKRNFTPDFELIKTKHCLLSQVQSLEIRLPFVLKTITKNNHQGCARFAEILLSARYCGVCAR